MQQVGGAGDRMWRRWLRLILAVVVPGLFLYLFFRDIDPGRLAASLRGVGWGWGLLILAALVQVFHCVLRAWRWRILLSPLKERTGFYNLFSAITIGYMVTMLLPGRIGEVLRPVMLAQREKISKGGALATIVLERLMDALSVATFLAIYLIFFVGPAGGPGREARAGLSLRWGAAAGAVIVLSFPLLWALVHFRSRAAALLSRLISQEGRLGMTVHRIFHGLVDGFEILKGGRALVLAWGYSFLIWGVISFSIWFSLLAFDIRIPVAGSLLMLGALTFGIAIPTQGGVGTYEWFGQQALIRFFGEDPSRAAAAVLVMHVFAITPSIVMGLWCVWREGLSFSGLTRRLGAGEAAPVPSGSGGAGEGER